MDKQTETQEKSITSTVHIGEKDFKVISFFDGKETASKLLCDLAVSRILHENPRTSQL